MRRLAPHQTLALGCPLGTSRAWRCPWLPALAGRQRGAGLDRDALGAASTWQEEELFCSTNPTFFLPGWSESWRGLPLHRDRAPPPPLAPSMPAAQGFHKLLLTSIKENCLQPGQVCVVKGLVGGVSTALCPKRHAIGLLVQPQTSSSLSCAWPPRAGKAQPCSREELVPRGELCPGRQKPLG